MAQTVARYSPHKMDTNKKKHPKLKRPRNHIYIEQTVEAMQMMQVLWGGVEQHYLYLYWWVEQQSDMSDTREKQIVPTVVAHIYICTYICVLYVFGFAFLLCVFVFALQSDTSDTREKQIVLTVVAYLYVFA